MADGVMGTAESDGFTISSNFETSEAMTAALAKPVAGETLTGPDATPASDVAETSAPALDVKKPSGKPRNDPQARVEEATGQAATAKRERDEARAEAAAFKARIDALEARANAPKPEAEAKPEAKEPDWKRYRNHPDAPKFASFQGDEAFEDWQAAMSMFVADRRYDERRQAERQQEQQQRVEQSESQRAARFSELIGATPEERQAFIATVDPRLAHMPRQSALPPGQKAEFGNFLVEQIYRSESPKELMVHFTAHPEDVQRLSTLHPMLVIREMGKLEGQLTQSAASRTTGTAPAPPQSKASPPITPVKGSSQSASDEPPGDEATDAQHDAYWSKQRTRFRS